MKRYAKGGIVLFLALGLALGTTVQVKAMPGYTQKNHPYVDSCKTCHKTDPYPASETENPANQNNNTPSPSANENGTGSPVNDTATKPQVLPQTGTGAMYLNYMLGAGMLVPGSMLLFSGKRKSSR